MIATGGSLLHCGAPAVRCAAPPRSSSSACWRLPEGLAAAGASGLAVRVVTAAVDERLDENAYIVPGLGDAGDRQFGAV